MSLDNGRIKRVTQLSTASTSVIAHGYELVVTTVALTTAAAAAETFTITNKKVQRISEIQLTVEYSGTTGIPVARIKSTARGSFIVMIANVHPTDPLNAVAKVHAQIVHN